MGIAVRARPGENIDSLIRRFHDSLIRNGVTEELAGLRNNFYKKPSLLKQEREKEKLKKIRENKR